MVIRAAALAAFGLTCMALGARFASSSSPARAPSPPPPPAVAHLSSEDRAELRRALTDEVHRAVAAALPAAASAAAPSTASKPETTDDAPAAPTAAAVAAQDTAQRVLDDALTRGAWRPEDGQAFRATMADLDPAATSQLLGELSRAINTGRLQIVARDRPVL